MAKIIVKRKNEWNNRGRKYWVHIDGEKKETISNGEIKEIELEPGKHKIIAKIDWMSTSELEFELTEERSKTFEISSFWASKWLFLLLYISFGIYFVSKIVLKLEYKEFLYVVFPVLLILLYYLSFGRKKYLEIKEL